MSQFSYDVNDEPGESMMVTIVYGYVYALFDVKEVPVSERVLSRILGEEDGPKYDPKYELNMYSFDWALGFDCSKSYTGDDFRHAELFLYGDWQAKLAQLRAGIQGEAWTQSAGSRPFEELINMSGGRGIIGTTVCDKLLRDFSDYKKRAMRTVGDFYNKIYLEFTKCFDMASRYQGVVVIHSGHAHLKEHLSKEHLSKKPFYYK